jgi:hypothetical protein
MWPGGGGSARVAMQRCIVRHYGGAERPQHRHTNGMSLCPRGEGGVCCLVSTLCAQDVVVPPYHSPTPWVHERALHQEPPLTCAAVVKLTHGSMR